MRGYTQLVHEQRYQIYALMKAGLKQTKIAEIVGVHKSTISLETRRNRGQRGCRPRQAHGLAMDRQLNRATARISDNARSSVESLLPEILLRLTVRPTEPLPRLRTLHLESFSG